MARVGAPLPPEQIPPGVAATIDRQNATAPGWARQAGQQRPAPPEIIALWVARTAQIVASWRALAPWKRARWSLCAWRKGVPANAPDGFIGWSGLSLYTQCWIDQNITPPYHPVSPCSRRATDPNASPWDWTP